jgi:hypothetical protein
MRTSTRHRAALVLLAVTAGLLVLGSGGPALAADPPLTPSSYTVGEVCQQPSYGSAGCLALRLVAKSPRAIAGARSRPTRSDASSQAAPSLEEFTEPIEESLTPAELRGVYNLAGTPPPTSTQTIAIVDAYDDPAAEEDLEHFDQQFGLPSCTSGHGCFRKVNQAGAPSPLPASNAEGKEPEAGWGLEISTDIEVAHSVCQGCHILLVEANSALFSDLEAAEEVAVNLGANVISNSWGGPECAAGKCVAESAAFDHPHVVITVAAGDTGFRDWDAKTAKERGSVDYPASSPHVVAVGGTRLNHSGGNWAGETVWNDGGQNKKGERGGFGVGGGGCSTVFTAPPWQQHLSDWEAVGCGTGRAVSDIAADADPYTGVAVYDSTPVTEGGEEVKGWNVLGGTSVASPIIASVFALAGGANGVEYPAKTLYENAAATPTSLHDVVSGSNGECLKPFNSATKESGCTTLEQATNSCASHLSCLASPGYDGPTGLGTPDGIAAFLPAAGSGEQHTETGASSPSAGSNSGTASPGTTSIPVTTASPPTSVTTIQPSKLALTLNAIIALNRSRPRASQVGFSFTLNAASHLRVTLAKRVRIHGQLRWQMLRDSITIAAASGRNSHHLNGRNVLASGVYRLTLAPVRGAARSIAFQIG